MCAQFYETLQRRLLVAQAVRLLDTNCSASQEKIAILGLEPQQVEELMPSEKVGLKNFWFLFFLWWLED